MNGSSWTDILQTIGIVAALCFTALELRARTREQKFRTYLDFIFGSVDLAKLMVENRDLHLLYEYSATDWTQKDFPTLNPAQKDTVIYCDLIIALCETVWLAKEEGYVAKDEWPYWRDWAHELNKSPAFRWALDWVGDDYDPDFLRTLHVPSPKPS